MEGIESLLANRPGRTLSSAIIRTLYERQGKYVTHEALLMAANYPPTDKQKVSDIMGSIKKTVSHCGYRIESAKGLGYLMAKDAA